MDERCEVGCMAMHTLESVVQGYHVYQTIWPDSFGGEELICE